MYVRLEVLRDLERSHPAYYVCLVYPGGYICLYVYMFIRG